MQIELLWIIPIIAFSSFIFIVIFFAQKKNEGTSTDLSREVAKYNYGYKQKNNILSKHSEGEFGEMESAISEVTQSLTDQRQLIDRFQKENSARDEEINDLKNKLRDLYKEYDIVLSENYSLKAKIKKLTGAKTESLPATESSVMVLPSSSRDDNKTNPNLRLYDDTRLLNLTALDDTSEIDLSEVR